MDLSLIVHAHAPPHAIEPDLAAAADGVDASGASQDSGLTECSSSASRGPATTHARKSSVASRGLAPPGVLADRPIPDLFARQVVSTHFGGSGRHFEPMKPWSNTLPALRAGVAAEEALHGRIAYNCSHLRSYFAKVAAQPEGHEPSECLNACRGQAHKHGYICRFCKEHVSSDLHQMKYGPCIRHFRRRACVLPEDELELFLSALDCVDEHYQRSSRQSEARHAERQAGRLAVGTRTGGKRSGSAQSQAGARVGQTSRSSSLDAGIPGLAIRGAIAWTVKGSGRAPMAAVQDAPPDEVDAEPEWQSSTRSRSQTPTPPGRSQRPLSDARYSPYITTALWPSKPATTDTRDAVACVTARSSTWPPPGAWPFDIASSGPSDPLPLVQEPHCKLQARAPATLALPSPFLPVSPEVHAALSHCWRRVLPSKMTASTSYARTELDVATGPSPGPL